MIEVSTKNDMLEIVGDDGSRIRVTWDKYSKGFDVSAVYTPGGKQSLSSFLVIQPRAANRAVLKTE